MKKTVSAWRETMREVLALRRNGYSGPFFVGLTLFLMGFWLMLPMETFGTSPVYDLMEEFAIEEFWGAIMSGTALIMVISSLRRRPREVALGSLVAAFVWFLVAASFAAGSYQSVTVPFSLVMTFRCLSLMREFKDNFDANTGLPLAHTHESSRLPGSRGQQQDDEHNFIYPEGDQQEEP